MGLGRVWEYFKNSNRVWDGYGFCSNPPCPSPNIHLQNYPSTTTKMSKNPPYIYTSFFPICPHSCPNSDGRSSFFFFLWYNGLSFFPALIPIIASSSSRHLFLLFLPLMHCLKPYSRINTTFSSSLTPTKIL